MKKLESLSEEQLLKMQEVKQYWLDYIFSCKNQINKQSTKIGIDWMYNLAKHKSPIIIYVESPMGCQYTVHLLKYLLILEEQQVYLDVDGQLLLHIHVFLQV